MSDRELTERARAIAKAAAGEDPKAAAIARAAAAVTPAFMAWFVAEVSKGTAPADVGAGFDEIVASALAGMLEHMRERHQTDPAKAIEFHAASIARLAAAKLQRPA